MGISKEHIISAFKESGKTQEQFCSEHGISLGTLQYYLYKKSKRSRHTLTDGQRRASVPASAPSFISFNRECNHRHPEAAHVLKRDITIIHGRFTLPEMVELITMLEEAGTC